MENILLLDTSVGSLNKGDEIIMECVRKELAFLTMDRFVLTLPTHISPFHWYQVLRNSIRVQKYADCRLKFACGTNLLVKDMLTHFPQWNINLFNCAPLEGTILVGVGASAHDKTNPYTTRLFRKVLSHDFIHSVRDERTKDYLENKLGLKAINTGCPTMWMLSPEFCKNIPRQKADKVVFTLTAQSTPDSRDQGLINILVNNYKEVWFWPQGEDDAQYIALFKNTDKIRYLEPTKEAYDLFLTNENTDYVGTRLHAGVYAMRHCRRSIIIVIDERAREINKSNNLNCIEKDRILTDLECMVKSEFPTAIRMPFDKIEMWKSQFVH